MNPQYRDLVLTGGATHVSKLSGAFLRPPTPMHLQFAYYQSSMVVQYVVERFGIEALQRILTDLGADVPINEALAKHTEPIDKLDESFAKWFREQAESLGSKDVNWDRPKLPLDAGSEEMAEWVKENPSSFFGLLGLGRALIAEGKFKDAIAPLEKAAAMHPGYAEAGGPYLLLAAAHRGMHDAKAERAMLEKQAALDADSVELRMRLMELATTENDHAAARKYAEQALAVNPLIPAPHRKLAGAAEALGERALAIQSHRTLLQLDPLDRAEHHFQLARLFAADEQLPVARKEVVRALEEAPRFRAAHQLLLDIAGRMEGTDAPPKPEAGAPAGDALPRPASPAAAEAPQPTPPTDTEVRQP
jgi:tetratricopeptide (TPR) repeat protein